MKIIRCTFCLAKYDVHKRRCCPNCLERMLEQVNGR
jgi:hypothetical protein